MSLALATGQTIAGSAGTGAVVTYTLFGDELVGTPPTDNFKILAQGQLTTSVATIYNPTTAALVKTILLHNTSASPITVTMFANGVNPANQIVSLLIPASGKATLSDDGWHIYDANGVQQYVGSTGPTGPRGATYIGVYSAAVNYVKDDVVTDNGSAWICLVANGPGSAVHAPPTWPTASNTWWSILSAKGDQGIQGIQGNPGVVTTVTAGAGLTGGGSAATVTVDVNPDNSTVEVVGDAVQVKDKGITNAKQADVATQIFKGRNTAGTGSPENLDMTTAKTMLGLGTAAFQPTTAFDAAGLAAAAQAASQPLDGDLTSIAALTTTSFGRSQLTYADAAAATAALNAATTALKGLMSAVDKAKLGGIWIDAYADLGLDKTGSNAATNTTKLQTAMTDATFTGGGVCYFPAGTYAFNGTIVVSKAVIFMGQGRSISNLRMDDAQLTMFAFAPGAQGAGFEQVRLTGNGNTFRNAIPTKTTIAAGSDAVVLPITGGVLNLTSAAGLPTSGVISFEARFPAVTGTPYWCTATYTGITSNQLTGVTSNPTANGRQIKAGDRAQAGGYAVDFGDIPNSYMQQCDILFHKSGVRSTGALQFLDDLNIREMNNANNSTSDATASECILVDGFGDRYLRRITTDNGDDWVWMAGIRISQCASCIMTDCNIINMNWALDIFANGGTATAVASVMALNSFFDSSSIGIRMRCATVNDTVQRIRFVQCWASTMTKIQPTTGGHPAGGMGVSMEHANVSSVDFIGCDFFQNQVGIDAVAASDWAVRSSRIAGNAVAGIRTAAGATHRFTIADNFIGNGAGFGANALGINVQVGAYDRYQILDNRGLDTNTTPGITDLGTTTYVHYKNVSNNLGAGLLLGVQNVRSNVSIAVVAETALHSIKVAANTLHAGTSFRVYGGGLLSNTTAASTSIIRVRIGPTTLTGALVASWSVVMGTVARTNNPFFLEAVFTLPAIGTAIGQILVTGTFSTALAAATTAVVTPIAINAAVDNFVEVTVTAGATTTNWNFNASALECLAI